MARFNLDASNPPVLTSAARKALDGMTDDEVTAAARADRENPPLSTVELAKLRTARAAIQARRRSGLSQTAFSRTFRISIGRLRDLEQGRTRADSALLAYLSVIERDPGMVRSALDP